jgi:hypothetical protein
MAATGVRNGSIPSQPGSINPMAPRISEIPIKRTSGTGRFSMPVCPRSSTNVLIENIDLLMPEYRKAVAVIAWSNQSIVFIFILF